MTRRIALSGIVFISCLASAFWIYCWFLGARPAFGFYFGNVVFGWVLVLLMSIPVMVVAMIPLIFADYAMDYLKPKRRFRAGACIGCGYAGAATLVRCPECGLPPSTAPTSDHVVMRALTWALLAWVLATVVGSFVGEVWLVADETAFRREVAAVAARNGAPTEYYRTRRWPAGDAGLFYHPKSGYRCED